MTASSRDRALQSASFHIVDSSQLDSLHCINEDIGDHSEEAWYSVGNMVTCRRELNKASCKGLDVHMTMRRLEYRARTFRGIEACSANACIVPVLS